MDGGQWTVDSEELLSSSHCPPSTVHRPLHEVPTHVHDAHPDDLTKYVEGGDGVLTIRGAGNCRRWNGIQYKPGLSAKNVGSRKLSMNVATIPPGGVAFAHIHVGFELMLYILQGRVRHEYGDGCARAIENEAGASAPTMPIVMMGAGE